MLLYGIQHFQSHIVVKSVIVTIDKVLALHVLFIAQNRHLKQVYYFIL